MTDPQIVDLSAASTSIAPANQNLFDDSPLQVKAPPPVPPSTHFYKLDKRLQSLETQIKYIGVPGSAYNRNASNGEGVLARAHWDLHGPRGGMQGLMLAPNLSGLMHLPFQQLMSEGPYQIGAIPERVDWRKREVGFAVMVGVGYGPDTSFRYRMLEERWWRSWSATEDGYWCVYTRSHGWRFLRVRLAEEPKTPLVLDPVAMDNNFMQWDCTAVAVNPFWKKRKEVSRWTNASDNGDPPPSTPWNKIDQLIKDILLGLIPGVDKLIPGIHIGEGLISVINRGDRPAWPLFIVSSPGRAWIQDGPGGNMTALPLLAATDGPVLIDTDPIKRTATATTDPVDPLFYRILRNSQLLDFLLKDITSSTLPVWRRMTGYFSVPWPARAVANIRVQHSNPNGSIVCLMPQHYGMGYA